MNAALQQVCMSFERCNNIILVVAIQSLIYKQYEPSLNFNSFIQDFCFYSRTWASLTSSCWFPNVS